LEKRGRAFDVGKKEGNRPGRQAFQERLSPAIGPRSIRGNVRQAAAALLDYSGVAA
jgi:hypothetical protein